MDPGQIIDSIVSILSSEQDPASQTIERLNLELTEALAPINARLRRCEKLLNDGQRSQAIELCETDPPLLELVAQLDFPERSVWDDYVEQFFLTPAPSLLVDVAAELNEAYTAQMSVQGLLDQFRLHSLARSPLSIRTSTLRQLVERDPNNLAWQQDLQAYERARLIEIKAEVDLAVARKGERTSEDLAVVAEAERELTETPWVGGRPAKLMDHVSTTHTTMRRGMARELLGDLAQKLTTAFAAFDIEKAREHRDRWNALSNIAGLEMSDPLYQLASPALHWIGENDRRDVEEQFTLQSLSDLDAAIDRGASRLELERLSRQATKGGHDLPAEVKNRYQARIAYLDSMSRRKSMVIVWSVVLAVVTAAVSVAFYYRHTRNVQEQASRVTALKQHIETGNLAAARDDTQACEKDAAGVFHSAEYQALVADLSVAETEEQSRTLHLEETLEEAQQTGLKSPTWTNLEAALMKVAEAEVIAGTRAGELARVKRVENELRKELRQLQEAVDSKYQADLQAIVSGLDSLDIGKESVVTETLEQARVLRKRERVSSELFSDLDLVITRLESMAKTSSEIREDEKFFEKVTASVGDTRGFTTGLENYLRRFPAPSRPHSEPIRLTVEEGRNLWPAVIRWNGFCGTWKQVDPYKMPASDAAKFANHARTLEKECAGYPFPDGFLPLVEHLEAVGKQVSPDGRNLFASLEALLNNPLYNKIYAVRTKSDEVFYCPKAPLFEDGRYKFDYFLDTGLSKKKQKSLLKSEVKIDDSETNHWDAPQWKLARDVIPLIKDLTPQTWDAKVEEAVRRVASDKSIDPILKLQLTTEILQTAMEGSLAIREAFSEPVKTMKSKVEQLRGNWIDPTNSEGRRIRRDAGETLVSVDLEKPFEELKRQQKSLGDNRWNTEYRWVGWVVKDYRDKWECRFKLPLGAKDTGSLWTIRVVDAQHREFEKVASVSDGQYVLDLRSEGLREGRPVFFLTSFDSSVSTRSFRTLPKTFNAPQLFGLTE